MSLIIPLTSKKGVRFLVNEDDLKSEESRNFWREVLSGEPEKKTSDSESQKASPTHTER